MASKKHPPMVAAIEENYIYCTGGAEIGMQVGDRVEILKPAKHLKHPKTGEDIGSYHTKVADAVVTHVMPKAAVLLRMYPHALAESLLGWGMNLKPKSPQQIEVGDLVGKAPAHAPGEPGEETRKKTDAEHKQQAIEAARKLLEETDDEG